MTKDRVDLICDVAELATLFEETSSLEGFLANVVALVADHMNATMCSVHLVDENKERLVLRAATGLNVQNSDSLHRNLADEIAHKALDELRPVRIGYASDLLPSAASTQDQDQDLISALAVPILRRRARVGALVVQHPEADYFTEHEARALRAIAAQLATTLENAKLLFELRRLQEPPQLTGADQHAQSLTRGVAASGGIALGEALVLGRPTDHLYSGDTLAAAAHLTQEDLDAAFLATEGQLSELQRQVEMQQEDVASSFIFGTHLLMLKDKGFNGRIRDRAGEGTTLAQSVIDVVNEYASIFCSSDDPVFQEKAQDVKDLGYRLLNNLLGRKSETVDYTGRIVIAADIVPSDILRFSAQNAEGIVLLGGTATSHVSILARSVRIPMVLTDDERILQVAEADPIIVDAEQGIVLIRPAEEQWAEYQSRSKKLAIDEKDAAQATVSAKTLTKDGTVIRVLASINLLRELKTARRFKAEGIGLYRSEFPFILRNDFPSEEEQFRIYKAVVDGMHGKQVTFRTLDVGGDKMLHYYAHVSESNPFFGLRAIRFALKNRGVFNQQLRALLRSSAGASTRIMFPFVSSVDDFLQARELVEEARKQLADEGLELEHRPPIGAMIELPSAVEIADDLARLADFLSIGTNDLVQYMLAVDRTNARVSELYLPHHPAVLRALKRIVDAGQRHDLEVSLCGEMGSDPRMLPFLLGIGIRCLTVDPQKIPTVQSRILEIDLPAARELASELAELSKISDIEMRLSMPSQ